jgi:hypothetical protein
VRGTPENAQRRKSSRRRSSHEHRVPIVSFIRNTIKIRLTSFKRRAIDKIPRTLASFGESIANQTGWHVTILTGGPTPDLDGQIMTYLLVSFIIHRLSVIDVYNSPQVAHRDNKTWPNVSEVPRSEGIRRLHSAALREIPARIVQ